MNFGGNPTVLPDKGSERWKGQCRDDGWMSEIELMRRVAAGDCEGIRELVVRHYDAIFRLLRHLTGSREDAEDLTQDVFLVARAKGGSYAGNGSVRSWLTRIAINADKKRRRRDRVKRFCFIGQSRAPDEVKSMLDSEWLLEGIARLPADQQVALLLHEVHGFSVSELAAITGSPEGTVKARLHYARKALQQILICPDGEAKDE